MQQNDSRVHTSNMFYHMQGIYYCSKHVSAHNLHYFRGVVSDLNLLFSWLYFTFILCTAVSSSLLGKPTFLFVTFGVLHIFA